jgi:hypothetical protein
MHARAALRRLVSLCVVAALFVPSAAAAGDPVSVVFVDSGQTLGSSNSRAVALGDLDGDGDLDAFVANYSAGNAVWLNDGLGGFSDSLQTLGSGPTTDVALADLDGDGDLDGFAINESEPDRVWLNNGAGVFLDSGQSLGNTAGVSVSVGDLDGDEIPDALVTHRDSGAPDNFFATVWINDGAGTFAGTPQEYLYGGLSPRAAVGDLDGDEDLDAFITKGYSAGANDIWLNDGDGGFSSIGGTAGSNCRNAALGDLDGDGDLDAFALTAAIGFDGPSLVLRNNGAAAMTDTGQTLGAVNNNAVALGDLDRDGDPDAFLATSSGSTVWTNDGAGFFIESGQTLGSAESSDVALADLDGDRDLDAFVASNGANSVWMNTTILPLHSDGFELGDQSAWSRSIPDGPAVTGIDPDSGLAVGGDLITITGTGLSGATDVQLDGTSCVSWTVLDDQHIQCETPPHDPAWVRVTVWRGAGHASSAARFRFIGTTEAGIGYSALIWPEQTTCAVGTTTESMRGRAFGPGLTDWTGPPPAMVVAEIGYGPEGTMPDRDPGWHWVVGIWANDLSANDEFLAALTCPAPGNYGLAFRASADGGLTYLYGDISGSTPGDPIDPAFLGLLMSTP